MSSILWSHKSLAALAGALFLVPVLSSPSLTAQERSFGGLGLTVYADEEFRGRNATFRDDVPDLRAYRLNDQITSLEVARGETWEVCEDVNFGGRCQVVSGTTPDLRRQGWSDTISSARRLRGRGAFGGRGGFGGFENGGPRTGIELYTEPRFGGRRVTFDEGVPNLQALNFNDRAMSVRLGRADAWEVCVDANYRNCRVIDADVADLSRLGLSTRISSLRPIGESRQRPFGRNARLYLYDQRNFRGEPFVIDDSAANLRNFSGRAESVRVEGGAWEVCTGSGFRGRCTVIDDDQSDLGRLGLRNNVSSARLVTRR